jgi:hypothetical protein
MEPFSVIAGTIGISSAFTACVDCFEYIQFGRHFGRDIQTDLLAISCARLRLSRWGEAVNIYDDPKLGRRDRDRDPHCKGHLATNPYALRGHRRDLEEV